MGLRRNSFGSPDGKRLRITTSLPPKYMTMDKGMLLPAITGRHKLYAMFHKGVWKLYDFMIKEDISIIDQPEGTLYSIMTSSKLHRIPDAADPENRLLAFGRDDTLTPTLYEDSTLV